MRNLTPEYYEWSNKVYALPQSNLCMFHCGDRHRLSHWRIAIVRAGYPQEPQIDIHLDYKLRDPEADAMKRAYEFFISQQPTR